MHLVEGLVALGLHPTERTQRGVRLAGHGCGLGAAAAHLRRIACGEDGGVEGIGRMRIHRNDADGETGLEGIFRVQHKDGVHGLPGVGGDCLLGVVGGLRELAAEVGENRPGVGGEGVGIRRAGVHDFRSCNRTSVSAG